LLSMNLMYFCDRAISVSIASSCSSFEGMKRFARASFIVSVGFCQI
jgi:hypothetical protein